ncbi:hypothetical protein FNV43_RR20936 [Rhamnella rubrinervis]|uniref:Uncharacterized protein n=1 Tax=Rhamnella rubrinervis TaxID=2594499 RepID=A0A8K0E1P7_9ROSA|nr:hypothetical protein FNV43_RR20936 [Rhamnella rubrinervis]
MSLELDELRAVRHWRATSRVKYFEESPPVSAGEPDTHIKQLTGEHRSQQAIACELTRVVNELSGGRGGDGGHSKEIMICAPGECHHGCYWKPIILPAGIDYGRIKVRARAYGERVIEGARNFLLTWSNIF